MHGLLAARAALGRPLGRGVLAFMRARGYCRAGAGDRRLALTPAGAAFLRTALGIDDARE